MNSARAASSTGLVLAAAAMLLLTFGVQLVSAGVLFSLADGIAALYTHDAAVVAFAAELIVLAALFQLSDGIQTVGNGALRGLKDTRVPMLITSASSAALRVTRKPSGSAPAKARIASGPGDPRRALNDAALQPSSKTSSCSLESSSAAACPACTMLASLICLNVACCGFASGARK